MLLVAQWLCTCLSPLLLGLDSGFVIKATFVTCEKSVVQSDSTKHRKFSPGTPVSPCSNTRPMGTTIHDLLDL